MMDEQIVMTPKVRTPTTTTILIERRQLLLTEMSEPSKIHVGGGDHTGIIVMKEISDNGPGSELDQLPEPPDLSLGFKVVLVNSHTKERVLENRHLAFWTKDGFSEAGRANYSHEFFKEITSPLKFPKDYVGFLTKILKLMQVRYLGMRKVEVEMSQLEEPECSSKIGRKLELGLTEEARRETLMTQLLEVIEGAYPNSLPLIEISRQMCCSDSDLTLLLSNLQVKGLIKAASKDNCSFMRVVLNESSVVPLIKMKQPSIAIITTHECEKLAVDAMIEDQETFVKRTTLGESNLYTVGNIGFHRVVSIKLPTVGGDSRDANIVAENMTTRLLGTFLGVHYVFIVGVGGGVSHRSDVRVGDIVVSAPTKDHKFMYTSCDKIIEKSSGEAEFETRGWNPSSFVLQDIGAEVQVGCHDELVKAVEQGIKILSGQGIAFARPTEIASPTTTSNTSCNYKAVMEPKIHLGPVASGKTVAEVGKFRRELAALQGILAFDSGYESVLDSIIGNRKDAAFILIRGIADYKDGIGSKAWHPHASILAAAFTKAIIVRMKAAQKEVETH